MRRMLVLLAVVGLVGIGGHAYSTAAVEDAAVCITVECPVPCVPTDCDPRDCPIPCEP